MVHWAQSSPHTGALFERSSLTSRTGDGLPFLSRNHSSGWAVFTSSDGSCRGSSARDRSLPLSERKVDPEELARRSTARGDSSISTSPPHDNIRGAEYSTKEKLRCSNNDDSNEREPISRN